ncbi:unnamed protein product [Acanthoscelides obtectus]|uniref:F-BAR and double SH3 domains protein 2 n=3 Tax=Acanthoscelides obtectus TaxID=200917 RepID=A0A9P0MDF1_ACAOB|nr:unnamed protein product [Acanthoscelides obtectus]CAH2012083.1 unnamed protein product [Acanthoscelides obtectus]CAK1637273.1 F-BAR and double SH3 domains protein 2 [Acanthoscelides obtectus]CAK1638805.1 F-BAR and double SH3 domains protein 2 [Acanthoscelides obtectus]
MKFKRKWWQHQRSDSGRTAATVSSACSDSPGGSGIDPATPRHVKRLGTANSDFDRGGRGVQLLFHRHGRSCDESSRVSCATPAEEGKMQPPPRKGNYAKFLKNLHTEQINKLLLKNQHECDLLEDIRTFVIKRSAIEKSYSEALLKISSAYLNKKIPNIPDIKLDGGDEKWNMWNVWRTVLEENEKLARARLAAIEVFQQQIADDAKLLRAHKMQMAKKCVDHLAIAQKELQNCVQEVDKTKKLYFDEEHGAHEVRDKARDIEEKLKKKKGSFFQSITSLQKNSAKFSTKRDQLEEKSTGARNDYLLCLAAANAHQTRYFVVDLQQCMQAMESGVYEKVAEYLTLMGRTELLTCSAMQNSYSTIRDQAKQLTREYNLQCCYLFYPVLKQHITYDFDRCDNDPVDKVSAPVSAECQETLAKEARRWATRIARDVNTIRECTRKLQMYNSMREQGQKTDPNDPNGPDLETKIDDLKQNIRRAETSKTKAEARIECLRQGGVNVDECMREAESLNVQDIQRSASSLSDHPSSDSYYDSDFAEGDGSTVPASTGAEPASTRRDSSDDEMVRRESQSEHQYESADVDAVLDQERQRIENLTAGWEDPTQVDWGTEDSAETETAESTGSAEKRASVPLLKCTALYSYTAQHPDELTIVENEQLEVVGEGDGDGWLRARNYRGEEGFVPQNYLDIEREPPVTSASGTPALVNQISFSSVDYTVDNDDTQRQAETATQSPEQISVISAGKGKEEEKREATEYCVAMYDYVGEADDELTFEEGQVIRILSRQAHSVDDGWWKGELLDDGIVGNFPSLVVEESDEYGQMLEDPEWDEDAPLSTPPVPQWSGVPPDVVPSLPSDGMDTLEDDIVSSPPQQPPPAPPPEVLEELAALEAMKALDDSPITNGFTHQDAFSEETEASKPQQPPAVQPAAQSTSSTSKTAQQKQQGFEMKMTRDQHHQYGSQFGGGQAPPPSIPGCRGDIRRTPSASNRRR